MPGPDNRKDQQDRCQFEAERDRSRRDELQCQDICGRQHVKDRHLPPKRGIALLDERLAHRTIDLPDRKMLTQPAQNHRPPAIDSEA